MKRALVALAGVAGAVVVAAPVAHAGPWDDPRLDAREQAYVNHTHNAICEAIQADPTPHGVSRVIEGIETQDHFSYHDTADIINVSVAKTCNQFMPLLTQIGDRSRPKGAAATHSAPRHVPVPVGNHWRWGGGILV